MATTKKYREFVGEPMGDKTVTDLPGIGDILGKRLKDKGFTFAYTVFGQYLVLSKNQKLFVSWIKDTAGANEKQAHDCYTCLKKWGDTFF